MTNERRLRVGLIGLGRVGALHATVIRSHPQSVVAAVCDRDPHALAQVTRTVPEAAQVTDWQQLLTEGELDVVVINTPNALHAPMAAEALRRGCHVLVEKPMAISVEQCTDLMALARTQRRRLAVGHLQRFLPAVVAARSTIDQGRLGEIWAIDDHRAGEYRLGHTTEWFFRPEVSGGGIMINLGAHSVDRCVWLGAAPVVEVYARRLGRGGSPVETDLRAWLRLANGVTCHLAQCSDFPLSPEIGPTADLVTITGTLGTLRIGAGHAIMRHNGETETLWTAGPGDVIRAFADQWAGFVEGVRAADSGATVSGEHGAHVVQVIKALYASADQGQTVGVGDLPAG